MIYNLRITIDRNEGALIRALGLIERRGFAVTSIHSDDSASETQMDLTLAVESQDRSVEVLARQIDRLCDVSKVQLVRPSEHVLIQERLAC